MLPLSPTNCPIPPNLSVGRSMLLSLSRVKIVFIEVKSLFMALNQHVRLLGFNSLVKVRLSPKGAKTQAIILWPVDKTLHL